MKLGPFGLSELLLAAILTVLVIAAVPSCGVGVG